MGGVEELPILFNYRCTDAIGFDIYAFDAPAHGKSSGLTTNLPEFIVTLDSLLKHWGPFEVILGHSGGAFASSHVCANHPEVQKLILISPFDKAIDIFNKYFELIGLGDRAQNVGLFSSKNKQQNFSIFKFNFSSIHQCQLHDYSR